MGQIQRIVTLDVCDTCGAESGYHSKCIDCGASSCYECKRKGAMLEYEHAVHFSGSGDGEYCKKCDAKEKLEPSPLYSAYRKIQDLRGESKRYWEDFKLRSDAAEAELKRLQKK